MKSTLYTLGIVIGVVVIVNLFYYLLNRRSSSSELPETPVENSAPAVPAEDESLLILKPIHEQEAYLQKNFPLQDLVEDVESKE